MKSFSMPALLVAMMAVSGFAVAQTNDVKSGTQGGAGPTGQSGTGDNGASVKSRAEVKSDRVAPRGGSDGGSNPNANPGTMRSTTPMAKGSNMPGMEDNSKSTKSRAEVKAEAAPMKSGIQGGEGASPQTNPNTMHNGASSTAAERKAARDQRRAERKMKQSEKSSMGAGGSGSMGSGSMSGSGMGTSGAVGGGTSMGSGTGATGNTLGQGQPSVPQKEGKPSN